MKRSRPEYEVLKGLGLIRDGKMKKVSKGAALDPRNLPDVCSFWLRDACSRGPECPFLHETPSPSATVVTAEGKVPHVLSLSSDQSIRDRYFGTPDATPGIVDSVFGTDKANPLLNLPEDKSITTLWVGGIGEEVEKKDLIALFHSYGEIRDVSLSPHQACAFLLFATREGAEAAAKGIVAQGGLSIGKKKLNIRWGRFNKTTPSAPGPTGGGPSDAYAAYQSYGPSPSSTYGYGYAFPQGESGEYGGGGGYNAAAAAYAHALLPPPPPPPLPPAADYGRPMARQNYDPQYRQLGHFMDTSQLVIPPGGVRPPTQKEIKAKVKEWRDRGGHLKKKRMPDWLKD